MLGGAPGRSKPRLLVVVTIDQFRADYLDRYRPQLIGGLGLLLREGAVFTDAFQDHALTETAPGHATILSGRWPAHTGILRNAAGVQDSTAPLLDVAGPGASPTRFQGSAFFDWLQAAEPAARALSVSRKDRAAILQLGRAKQQVYWYVHGVFTTSRYYADSLPPWVRAFDDEHVPLTLGGATWSLLLPETEYPEPDSEPYEHGGQDFVFPHRLPADSTVVDALTSVPTMDSLTLAFALVGVRALGLGGRGATDLLAVSLSATDAIGHLYGPDSREIHDQVLRVDRYLGWFLGQLFVRYSEPGVVVALTADHGVTSFPEWSRAHGHPDARRVSLDSLVLAANARLDSLAGIRGPWLTFDTGMLLLPDRAKLVAAGINVDSVITILATRVRALPGVARVERPSDLTPGDTADPVDRRWRHALPPGAPVELVVTLAPYSIWGPGSIAEHGQPSDIDAHVPLILWGRGIRRGTYGGRVSAADLAPTLAQLLGIVPTEPIDGRVLVQALAPEN